MVVHIFVKSFQTRVPFSSFIVLLTRSDYGLHYEGFLRWKPLSGNNENHIFWKRLTVVGHEHDLFCMLEETLLLHWKYGPEETE